MLMFALGGAVLLIIIAACVWYITRNQPPMPDRLELVSAGFADLDGWADDQQSLALGALQRSCEPLLRREDAHSIGPDGLGGTVADWRVVCMAAKKVIGSDSVMARKFFETYFLPLLATNNGVTTGLFTGYYEPILHGSRVRTGEYNVPIYAKPGDLVTVNLESFNVSMKGQRLVGRVIEGRLLPYLDRKEIESGALDGRNLEIVWVNDAIDAFFLHIQGSGRVILKEGGTVRIGYAAKNGHEYFSIGKWLVAEDELSLETVSMQTIREWLRTNPSRALDVMAKNPSYIFFKNLNTDGVIGSQGVQLTAERSLAVDVNFVPLGIPVWVNTQRPSEDPKKTDPVFRQLLVTQDTGSAIRGPIRGDVFWGDGDIAEKLAGRMKHQGSYYLLLPIKTVERLKDTGKIKP